LETPQPAISDIPTTPQKQEGNAWRNFAGILLDLAETVLLSIVLFLGINAVTARVLVEGQSMRPTLDNGEYILVNKMAFRSTLPDYGDIVVFHFPISPDQDFIKRVVALPGDKVNIQDGQVRVNDHLLEEPYIAAEPRYAGTWQVPDEEIFVLGDNRNNSSDSHSWGAVPMDNVIGKAIFVYWPPPAWKTLEHVQIMATQP